MTSHAGRPGAAMLACIEADTRNGAVARRNVLAALWAGRLMGLSDAALEAYAAEVHAADYQRPGEGDVVEKLTRDLRSRGLPVPVEAVRAKIGELQRAAWSQVLATD